MSLRHAALLYGEFLLCSIRHAARFGRWAVVDDLCDRFERLMENLPPVAHPLVWDGDNA